jgi:hypothetical protein
MLDKELPLIPYFGKTGLQSIGRFQNYALRTHIHDATVMPSSSPPRSDPCHNCL